MRLVWKISFLCCLFIIGSICSQAQGSALPEWTQGTLDIHHIHTGRGDAAFFILPDGTTLLVDAGDMSESHPRTLSVRNAPLMPNSLKSAPEWIVDYIRQFAPANGRNALDYALITHYHDDHFGQMDARRKQAEVGQYYLTGITGVGHLIDIKKILDRGNSYPIDLKDSKIQQKLRKDDAYGMIVTLQNYWSFIDYQSRTNGLLHETIEPGRANQIKLVVTPQEFPDFQIRNIAVNGIIWTGEGIDTQALFSSVEYSGENPLSICIKLSYGAFDYFTGGDISGIDSHGGTDLASVESQIAEVIGPVDVATLNHHRNRDSQNVFYVRTIRPRVWIQQNWSSDHPGEEVLRRITSETIYPGERDIFSTVMLQANKDVIGERLDAYKSQNGHIVIRVAPGGSSYEIFILEDTNDARAIKSKHGPYESK